MDYYHIIKIIMLYIFLSMFFMTNKELELHILFP